VPLYLFLLIRCTTCGWSRSEPSVRARTRTTCPFGSFHMGIFRCNLQGNLRCTRLSPTPSTSCARECTASPWLESNMSLFNSEPTQFLSSLSFHFFFSRHNMERLLYHATSCNTSLIASWYRELEVFEKVVIPPLGGSKGSFFGLLSLATQQALPLLSALKQTQKTETYGLFKELSSFCSK
jgi:hypothetical protein